MEMIKLVTTDCMWVYLNVESIAFWRKYEKSIHDTLENDFYYVTQIHLQGNGVKREFITVFGDPEYVWNVICGVNPEKKMLYLNPEKLEWVKIEEESEEEEEE